jgi:membrane fusion protein, multidrug efflux system
MSESCSIAWLIGCRLVFTPFTKQCGAAFDSTATRLNQVRPGEISVKPNRECHPSSSPRLLQFVFTLLVPLTFITLSGCDRQNRSGNLETAKKTQAAAPAEVSVVTIAPKTLPVKFEAIGQTEGSREVEVRARVGGILLRRDYSAGTVVKQGTLLFKIDSAPSQAALNKVKGILEQEEAQLEKAKRDERGLRPLFAENAVIRKDRRRTP